jgi:hypothetical protein
MGCKLQLSLVGIILYTHALFTSSIISLISTVDEKPATADHLHN